jgi:signal recognition particle subunit SEC65
MSWEDILRKEEINKIWPFKKPSISQNVGQEAEPQQEEKEPDFWESPEFKSFKEKYYKLSGLLKMIKRELADINNMYKRATRHRRPDRNKIELQSKLIRSIFQETFNAINVALRQVYSALFTSYSDYEFKRWVGLSEPLYGVEKYTTYDNAINTLKQKIAEYEKAISNIEGNQVREEISLENFDTKQLLESFIQDATRYKDKVIQ